MKISYSMLVHNETESLERLIPGSTTSVKKGTMSLYGLNRSVINKFLKSSKDI